MVPLLFILLASSLTVAPTYSKKTKEVEKIKGVEKEENPSEEEVQQESENHYDTDDIKLKDFQKLDAAEDSFFLQRSKDGLPVKATWFDAVTYCLKKDMILATPNSKEKNHLLKKVIKNNLIAYAWIAASDLVEGEYVFLPAEKLTFTDWFKGEPNNYYGEEHCVEFDHKHEHAGWNDKPCHFKSAVVCQPADIDTRLAVSQASKSYEKFFKKTSSSKEKAQ